MADMVPELEEVKAQLKSGDAKKAKNILKGFLKNAPNDRDGLYLLATVYREEKRYARARKCLERLLEGGKNDPQARYLDACLMMEEGQYAPAAKELEKFVLGNPQDSYAYNSLAFCFSSLGRAHEAEEALKKAVTINPADPFNYWCLARLLMDQGKPGVAETYLKQGLKAVPRDPKLRDNLARLMLQKGDVEGARQEFDLLIKHYPNLDRGYLGMGNCHQELKHWDKALASYETAREKDPKGWQSYAYIGDVHHERGELERAADYYAKSLELFPDNPKVQANLGEATMRLGLVIKPFLAFKQAIGVAKDYQYARYLLAKLYVREELYEQAEAELEEARKLDPKDVYAQNMLVDLYLKLGRTQDAHKLMEGVPEDVDDRHTQFHRARLWLKEGRKEDAKGLLRKLMKSPERDELYEEMRKLLG